MKQLLSAIAAPVLIFSAIAPASAQQSTLPDSTRITAEQALSEMQRYVTEGGTEPAFDNAYWNNKEEGIYVDIVTGEPLFSSKDKFDSGTGWPSFTKPIDKAGVETRADTSLGMERTEIVSAGGTHLGHVFDDGPADKGGKRFCVNSASLRFVPKDKLDAEGYDKYVGMFE